MELVPSKALPERNFKQSSPSAFGGPHLFGKCGTLAYPIRDAEAITRYVLFLYKKVRLAMSCSQTRRLHKKCGLVG